MPPDIPATADGVPPDAPSGPADATGVPRAGATPPRKLKKRRVRRMPSRARAASAVPERVIEPPVVRRAPPPPDEARPPQAGWRARGDQLVEVDVEREVIGTQLYRERRVEERVVEVEVRPPTKQERRQARGRERARAALRPRAPSEGALRATLGYKLFYDLVCNRLGLVLAGFGSAMLLFAMLYDPLRRQPLEFGHMHMLGLAVAGAVYLAGMLLEMLRAWSWECDAAETEGATPVGAGGRAAPEGKGEAGLPAPIPLVPEDAVERLRSELGKGGAL